MAPACSAAITSPRSKATSYLHNYVSGFSDDACTGGGNYCRKGAVTLVNNVIFGIEAMFDGGGIEVFEVESAGSGRIVADPRFAAEKREFYRTTRSRNEISRATSEGSRKRFASCIPLLWSAKSKSTLHSICFSKETADEIVELIISKFLHKKVMSRVK